MKCVVTNWEYLSNLCRVVAEQVVEDGFEPDVIVALARGGWFVGSVLCDILGLEELVSLRVEHYKGVERKEVKIRNAPEVKGDVLIVDDIVNTGMSMKKAKEFVEKTAKEVRTACLLLLANSKFLPNYFGEYLEDFVWVIFPWNFVEDVSSLIMAVMREKELWSEWEIKSALHKNFDINPIQLEIAQPNRFRDVLMLMEKKGLIERVVLDEEVYWKLK